VWEHTSISAPTGHAGPSKQVSINITTSYLFNKQWLRLVNPMFTQHQQPTNNTNTHSIKDETMHGGDVDERV
jgi:hypothetical protein